MASAAGVSARIVAPQLCSSGRRSIGRPPPADTQAPPSWIAYVNVDDVDAAPAKVKALSGMVHAGPFPVPTIGQIAIIGDPQGAALGLIQPDMPS